MGSIKDKSGMDLTEAEDIKKRWQEYTEELHKKGRSALILFPSKQFIFHQAEQTLCKEKYRLVNTL